MSATAATGSVADRPSSGACSLCGREAKHYPYLPMFDLGPVIVCAHCVRALAARADELESRAAAARTLERADQPQSASMSDLVAGMASSIRGDPGEWWTDGYKLFHANGVRVWIANGHGYLKITIPQRGEFTPTWWQRRKLWNAVSLWRGRPLPDFWRYNPCRPEEAEHRV